MKQALKIGLLVEMKHPKNIMSLLLVICAIVGSMFYVHSQMAGDQIYEQTGEFYAIQSALTRFQVVDASETGDGSPIYKNLHQQKRAVSLQLAALKMGKDQLYYNTSLKLANLRAEVYSMEDFDKIAGNMPSEIETKMEQVYYTYLAKHEAKIYNNTMQYWAFLLFIFSMIGAGWYVFVSLYTSAILLEDYEHSSVVKGYPIAFHTYMLSKCVTAFFYICTFIAFLFICSLPLIAMHGIGDPNYPVVFYIGDVVVLKTWQFIAIVVVLMLIVAVFVMTLSIILNVWLKNMYLTLFVHMICFFLPIVFPKLISWIPFNPFHFTQFNQILDAFPLSLAKPVDITIIHGIVILLIAIAIMVFVIKRFFSIGKISRV